MKQLTAWRLGNQQMVATTVRPSTKRYPVLTLKGHCCDEEKPRSAVCIQFISNRNDVLARQTLCSDFYFKARHKELIFKFPIVAWQQSGWPT